VLINVSDNQKNCVTITFKDVLFIPGLKERSKDAYLRLMSMRATMAGCHCNFSRVEDTLVS
jgi:hypothetical protein